MGYHVTGTGHGMWHYQTTVSDQPVCFQFQNVLAYKCKAHHGKPSRKFLKAFIPLEDHLQLVHDENFNTCATFIHQRSINAAEWRDGPSLIHKGLREEVPFTSYTTFAKRIASFISEVPHLESCSVSTVIHALDSGAEFDWPILGDEGQLWKDSRAPREMMELLQRMTFFWAEFNFLIYHLAHNQTHDHQVQLDRTNSPRRHLQQLGLFEDDSSYAAHSPDTGFSVAFLNAAFLYQIVGVKIQWTFNIGAHLMFDEQSRHLSLFSLPSFCEICANSKEGPLHKQVPFPLPFCLGVILTYRQNLEPPGCF